MDLLQLPFSTPLFFFSHCFWLNAFLLLYCYVLGNQIQKFNWWTNIQRLLSLSFSQIAVSARLAVIIDSSFVGANHFLKLFVNALHVYIELKKRLHYLLFFLWLLISLALLVYFLIYVSVFTEHNLWIQNSARFICWEFQCKESW